MIISYSDPWGNACDLSSFALLPIYPLPYYWVLWTLGVTPKHLQMRPGRAPHAQIDSLMKETLISYIPRILNKYSVQTFLASPFIAVGM